MSEFSMMTGHVPWPIAYGSLMLTMGFLVGFTYIGLRVYEKRKNRIRAQSKGCSYTVGSHERGMSMGSPGGGWRIRNDDFWHNRE
ncbi:hypothetical protein MTBBW1_810002 [Desulfamplus magnetovallimortis]|uniref:Uncharacterized protein n=1 Tax=Desulfamplus magnetovallimortis TaxID=1246637 RepID=A0A1W1HKA2_9BACT|nr:hypothetical protein MTBBW1_810002 [Desulfamplus magnetovallimortis]